MLKVRKDVVKVVSMNFDIDLALTEDPAKIHDRSGHER